MFQDENGEWYYDDRSTSYEGWYQDENGEWVEDPNYSAEAETGETSTENADSTENKTDNKLKNKTSFDTGSVTADSKNSENGVNGDIHKNNDVKNNEIAQTINGSEKSTPVVPSEPGASAASTATLEEDTPNAEKLPPRPADYDYYWYQDEDGNWRNEYDDYG